MKYPSDFVGKILCGDSLELMREIPDGSVDLVLTDPPYGITACKWDKVVDLDKMWAELKRIGKGNCAFLFTASQPFTSKLIMSNLKMFKYEWIWEKGRASGFLHSKNKPLKAHENILVFGSGTTVHKGQSVNRMIYNPQMVTGLAYFRKYNTINTGALNHYPSKVNTNFIKSTTNNEGTRYPKTIIKFKNHNIGNLHPTQKPVALFQYLIQTYSNEGDLILDCFAGSGTTGVACKNLNRNFILIEKEEKYCEVARQRLLSIPDSLF